MSTLDRPGSGEGPPRLTAAPWIRASFLGWLLGLLAIVALAMVSDVLGGQVQVIVGVGMGIGLGTLQGRCLGGLISSPSRWVGATTLGLGLPFLAWDLGSLASLGPLFGAPRCILAGGLLAGVAQGYALRVGTRQHVVWSLASTVAWGVPAGLIALGDSHLVTGPVGALLPVATYLFGGLLVGAVSAWPLVRVVESGK